MAFDTLKLEKGMYAEGGKSFTQVLEQLDPSENYRGTSMEHMDAFQRQLKRFDIKVKGPGSDPVEKFFATWESAVLFPEYVNRMVRQGMSGADQLKDIVATVTKIESMDYRSMYSAPSTDEKKLAEVGEGSSIPETTIRLQEQLVHLKKRGRILSASYEAIRFQKLDLFSVMLRQIGENVAQQQLEDAVNFLCNQVPDSYPQEFLSQIYMSGDDVVGGTAGVLDYGVLLNFWAQFHPYTMNTMIAPTDMIVKTMMLEEVKNPLMGFSFQKDGAMVSPLGAKFVRCDGLPAGVLIGLDNRYALEKVQVGDDVNIEYDKLIDRQLERAAITSICGFSRIQPEASKILACITDA